MNVYLQHTLMSRMLLQLDEAIQYDQLHVIITLLNDQVDITLSRSLNTHTVTLVFN